MLHACHEAREEGLRFYTSDIYTEYSQNRVYFNYALDTLYFREVWDVPEDPNNGSVHSRFTDDQLRAFADALPHKDRIRRFITADVWGIARKFPAAEEVGMIQRVHVNNDGNCEACNFKVIKNRTYFFNADEEIHVCRHLETSAKGRYVNAEEFSKTWKRFMDQMERGFVDYTGWMSSQRPELQWKEPIVRTQSVFVGHIMEEETYCKVCGSGRLQR